MDNYLSTFGIMKTKKAAGVLGRMLANIDELSLAKTRNRMLIAAKIADAMHSKKMNQKQLAQKMGKTESEISEWLSGDRNFTMDTLTEIGHVLGISLFDTESTQYSYSTKVERTARIIPIGFSQQKKYTEKSFQFTHEYCNYKRNGAY